MQLVKKLCLGLLFTTAIHLQAVQPREIYFCADLLVQSAFTFTTGDNDHYRLVEKQQATLRDMGIGELHALKSMLEWLIEQENIRPYVTNPHWQERDIRVQLTNLLGVINAYLEQRFENRHYPSRNLLITGSCYITSKCLAFTAYSLMMTAEGLFYLARTCYPEDINNGQHTLPRTYAEMRLPSERILQIDPIIHGLWRGPNQAFGAAGLGRRVEELFDYIAWNILGNTLQARPEQGEIVIQPQHREHIFTNDDIATLRGACDRILAQFQMLMAGHGLAYAGDDTYIDEPLDDVNHNMEDRRPRNDTRSCVFM